MQALELLIDNSTNAITQDVRDGETIQVYAQGILDDRRSRSGLSIWQTIALATCFKCTGNSGIKAKSDAFHSITEMNPADFASPSGAKGVAAAETASGTRVFVGFYCPRGSHTWQPWFCS